MHSAFQKLRRADDHLTALKVAFQRFNDTKPHHLVQGEVTECDRRYGVINVGYARPIPTDFGLIIGDVCNNLRSALDHLLWYFHVVRNAAFDRNVYFPIFESEAAFKKTAGSKNIGGLSAELKALFEWAQPYKRGNNLLPILRKLNDTDKHRLIRVLAATADFEGIQISAEVFIKKPGEKPAALMVPTRQRIEQGTELIRFPLPEPKPERGVNVNVGLRYEVVFGDTPEIANGLPVGETLTAIRTEVNAIFDHFRTYTSSVQLP